MGRHLSSYRLDRVTAGVKMLPGTFGTVARTALVALRQVSGEQSLLNDLV